MYSAAGSDCEIAIASSAAKVDGLIWFERSMC